MRGMIEFWVGCFGFSVVLTYAWWTRLRVWALRQDLFTIRDNLWDQMEQRGRLDDPAYVDLRDTLNSMIRLAPFLSILTVLRLLLKNPSFKNLLHIDEGHPELRAARATALARTARYLLFETITGLLLSSFAAVYGIASAVREELEKRLGWLLDSRALQGLDQRLSLGGRGRIA